MTMPGFSSIDNFVSEVTGGKFWRQEFSKLYAGGTAVAGNWYDLTQGNGVPCQYLHGNLVANYDFVTSQFPWVIGSANWAYTPGTHLMTRTAHADVSTLSQTLRLKRGVPYMVVYTSGRTAGGITVSLGGTNGTARTTAATFREIIYCGSTSKDIVFTPDASFAGTIDLVAVQPMLDFLPYNDQSEGALYHGGDVAPDTKHLVNMGAWANFATGLPAVLMLVDVLGVHPRIQTDSALVQELTGTASVGTIIDNCQDAWNEETITNVTSTLVVKSTEGIAGASPNGSCCKFAITDTFATGKICDEVITSLDMRRVKYVYMWLRSSINLNAGDLSFCTDESAALASSQDTLINTALTANTWTRVQIDYRGSNFTSTDIDAVISIGLKAINDKNLTYNLYVDDVICVREDPVLFNGEFTGASTGWTLNAGWAYRSNDIERTAGAGGQTAEQTLLPVVQKCPYSITYTIANRSAGGVTVSLGGTNGTQRTADGTYTETIVCGTTNFTLAFTPDETFNGRIDDVFCFPIIPRADDTGTGVRALFVMDNALSNGANAATAVMDYTNQAGTERQQLGATIVMTASDVVAHVPHSGVAAGKYGPYLPLEAGDYGIRSVQSFQFSAAQATAQGAVNLLLVKPITSIPITTAYVAAERDLMNQLPSLPRIRDGACLMFLVFVGGVIAAGSQFQGYIETAWS
jgi:hypothetical protein